MSDKLLKGVLLVGIMGKAGAGKDTVAELLSESLMRMDAEIGVYRKNLADNLKSGIAEMLGMELTDFYNRDLKEKPNEVYGKSPREIAQYVGTEAMRTFLGGDVWINSLLSSLAGNLNSNSQYAKVIIVADIRFKSEADWIARNDGILLDVTNSRVASAPVGIKGHPSEAGFDIDGSKLEYWVVLNERQIVDLAIEVRNLTPRIRQKAYAKLVGINTAKDMNHE